MKMCSENIYICKAQWVLGSAMHLAGIDWCGTMISVQFMMILSHKSPIFRYLFIPRVSSNLINLSVYLRLCSSLWHSQMVTRSRVWKDFNKIKLMLLTQVTALTVTNCDDLKSLLHDKKHRSKIRDYCVCSIGYLTHLPILPWGGRQWAVHNQYPY